MSGSAGTKARASASTSGIRAAMNTGARMAAQLEPVAHEPGSVVRRRDRAHRRASFASRQSSSRELARVLGVSESRVRHQRTDDQAGALTLVCDAAADPKIDGEAIRTAIEEALIDRDLNTDRKTLEGRLAYLVTELEHVAQAGQDRALMLSGPGTNDAIRKHAGVLLEIAALRERLGLEETCH